MRFGRIGGLLILASCGLLLGSGALALAGNSVSVGGDGAGGVAATLAVVLFALGAASLAVAGPATGLGRLGRVGLAIAAVGVVAVVSTAHVGASSMLVVVYLLGGALNALGVLLAAVSLLATPGRPRAVGLTFLVGLALVAVAAVVSSIVLQPGQPAVDAVRLLATGLGVAGAIVLIVGLGRLGWLGFAGTAETVA
jgi:hypothetical protein